MVNPDDPAPGPDVGPEPTPEDEPDNNLIVSPNVDSYSFYTSTGQFKVTLSRTDGELTPEDKTDWTVEDLSNELEQSGNASITTKGVVTFTVKRVDPLSYKTNTINMKVKHNNATYAVIPVTYSPYATITTDNSTKLTTDGAENITALKINGSAVDINDYKISSADITMAVVENNIITPLKGGQAVFNVSPKTDMSLVAQAKITFYEPAAKVGDKYYKTIANAFKDVKDGETVVLQNDTVEAVSFAGTAPRAQEFNLTFDLNGHTLTAPANSDYGLRVDYGTVTLKDSVGTGGINYGRNYAIIVSHLAGDYPSQLIIESGNYTGKTSVVQCGFPGGTGANYKYYGGDLIVKGGTFTAISDTDEVYDSNGNFRYELNLLDMNESAYAGGIYSPSSIAVEGGRFYKFNPADNAAEGEHTNFVSDGFVSVKNADWYEVKAI